MRVAVGTSVRRVIFQRQKGCFSSCLQHDCRWLVRYVVFGESVKLPALEAFGFPHLRYRSSRVIFFYAGCVFRNTHRPTALFLVSTLCSVDSCDHRSRPAFQPPARSCCQPAPSCHLLPTNYPAAPAALCCSIMALETLINTSCNRHTNVSLVPVAFSLLLLMLLLLLPPPPPLPLLYAGCCPTTLNLNHRPGRRFRTRHNNSQQRATAYPRSRRHPRPERLPRLLLRMQQRLNGPSRRCVCADWRWCVRGGRGGYHIARPGAWQRRVKAERLHITTRRLMGNQIHLLPLYEVYFCVASVGCISFPRYCC